MSPIFYIFHFPSIQSNLHSIRIQAFPSVLAFVRMSDKQFIIIEGGCSRPTNSLAYSNKVTYYYQSSSAFYILSLSQVPFVHPSTTAMNLTTAVYPIPALSSSQFIQNMLGHILPFLDPYTQYNHPPPPGVIKGTTKLEPRISIPGEHKGHAK